ncbi:MAG: MGMT family protein [Candidatus Thorarchaeota archaeon]
MSLDQVKFDFSDLTDKTIRILRAVLTIPRGETRTYKQVAKMAGLDKAVRFVGTVMAKNRFAPIIPCHRVISANGIGGYSGGDGMGVATKKYLLHLEGAKIAKKDVF